MGVRTVQLRVNRRTGVVDFVRKHEFVVLACLVDLSTKDTVRPKREHLVNLHYRVQAAFKTGLLGMVMLAKPKRLAEELIAATKNIAVSHGGAVGTMMLDHLLKERLGARALDLRKLHHAIKEWRSTARDGELRLMVLQAIRTANVEQYRFWKYLFSRPSS
jgi:hypothetical protein